VEDVEADAQTGLRELEEVLLHHDFGVSDVYEYAAGAKKLEERVIDGCAGVAIKGLGFDKDLAVAEEIMQAGGLLHVALGEDLGRDGFGIGLEGNAEGA